MGLTFLSYQNDAIISTKIVDVFTRNEVTSYRMKSYFRYYKLLSRYMKLIVSFWKTIAFFVTLKSFKRILVTQNP